MERLLIVNADDFGQSPGINRGVVEAFERGVVTSASLMVRWPASREAAAYARRQPRLSVGLHLDLGEAVWRAGAWRPRYAVVPLADARAVAREVRDQVAAFRDIMGRDPTHVDSHQHVHLRPEVAPVAAGVAAGLGVPLRGATPGVAHRGDFHGQTAEGAPLPGLLTVAHLVEILDGLAPGVTELGCHPGYAGDLETTYRSERAREVAVLCDPRVRAAVAERGIVLGSFHDVAARGEWSDAARPR